MRRSLLPIVGLMMVALLLLPSAVGRLFARSPAPVPAAPSGADSLVARVYFPEARQIQRIALRDYLKGVVAAEMPAEFEMEALKAQFVVARTYTVRRMSQFNGESKGGCSLEPRADVCADARTSQAYTSRAELEERLGKVAADAVWKRLEMAEAGTAGLVLTFAGSPIDPLYHSVSGTVTEDAAEYFGTAMPYLKSVDDSWGADSPKMYETRRFTPDALARALSAGQKKAIPATAAVRVTAHTATGRVKAIRVGGTELSGRDFRERLGLRSTDFTVALENGEILIRTRGYGHGVGMSQYGANGMAKAGKGFGEILTHYYPGTRMARIFEDS